MAESNSPIHEEPVCATWQRMLEGVLGIFLLGGVALIIRYYPAAQPIDLKKNDLQKQVQQLSREVQQLEQEQAMPALVLHRYRNSICYVFGIYQVGFAGRPPELRARISGTGFVVSDGLLATNRHGLVGSWRAVQETDMRQDIACITRPTLVIAGEHDTVTAASYSVQMAKTIPGATLLVLPAVHLSNIEFPREFVDAVVKFVLSPAA